MLRPFATRWLRDAMSFTVTVVPYTSGPESAYDDVIFGDHGEILQYVFDPNVPDPPLIPGALQKIQTTQLKSILAINSVELQKR
jgi:hypothetical protein